MNMSYCDSNARTGLDWRRTSSTRFGADFAAQIGRCSRSNSTEPASARRLSVDKTAYGADRTYHSPIREGLWRSVAVRELSITQGDRCRKGAPAATVVSTQRDLVATRPPKCYWNGVSFVFPYCYFGISGNTIRGSALSGPIFQALAFRYWFF